MFVLDACGEVSELSGFLRKSKKITQILVQRLEELVCPRVL
jgi:hypothetical protein